MGRAHFLTFLFFPVFFISWLILIGSITLILGRQTRFVKRRHVMSIITVSRETGSLGDETARLISEELGFVLLDRNALESVIDDETFPDIPTERFDEQSPSFWENFTAGKDVYLDRLRTAMLETAVKDNVVILGRGGQFILQGVPGVFRVRMIAGHDTRVARIQESMDSDHRTAERYCRRSDHDRNGFSRFFFGGQWSDPASYDLTLCTDQISSVDASRIISRAFRASGMKTERGGGTILRDRLIAQIVRNRILYVEKIPVDLLEVESEDGHVTVRGTVTVKENAKRCEDAAQTVEGVKALDAEVYFVNPVMTY